MSMWSWVERSVVSITDVVGLPRTSWHAPEGRVGGQWNARFVIGFTAIAGLTLAVTFVITSRRGGLKSPWSRGRIKNALSLQQWKNLFTSDGNLRDGEMFLKKVRSGGVDPDIRREVWPFLLGVYHLNSSDAERIDIGRQKRKEYKNLRKRCLQLLKSEDVGGKKLKDMVIESNRKIPDSLESPISEDDLGIKQSISVEGGQFDGPDKPLPETGAVSGSCSFEEEKSDITHVDVPVMNTESSLSDHSEEKPEIIQLAKSKETELQNSKVSQKISEDFTTWQRIIRLDAIRANGEWISYGRSQATVSDDDAHLRAEEVGLKDYHNLEPCRIYHAARLVAVLEAYALYDPDIGYCQGMSDLLSPIITVMEEDDEAFWCFVGFMSKSRHNFRLDEVGIKRQLNLVSKIIKSRDAHLYNHLERLEAQDCFFVYRMVVVLFRRELSFEQTLCLWEVMWADQAAIRAGIGKSAWGLIRLRAPPTEDLLLYAIAASVLQKRKLIIEKHSSLAEIMWECNSMAGQLDVWKLLDDAHDLVVRLHDKIS